MPYDPVTGEWKEEETGVAKRMTGLLSRDTEYMQQAATRGRQAANRRGLLNSTMAVQGVEAARIRAALPIASQESAQAQQRNLQGRNIQFQDVSQQRDIGARREFLGTDIASREAMQGRDIEAAQQRLDTDIAAAETRLGRQLTHDERMQMENIDGRERMQGADIVSREGMQALDIESRDRISNMNLASIDRNAAAQMAQGFDANYAQTVSNIMNNPDIPAAERQRYLDHAARVRDSNYNLIEQMYGIDLEWTTAGSSTTPRPGGPPGPRGRTTLYET